MGDDDLGPKLLAYLRALLELPRLEFAVQPKPLANSGFTSIWAFELRQPPPGWEGQLVLRFINGMPMQVRCEAGLQDGARASGLPAPRVLTLETQPGPLGARFVIMERLPGKSFRGGIDPLRFVYDLPKLVWPWPARFESILRQLGEA